ncbi:MAG: hypothetical protein K2J20_06620, partial [Bacilli bacterium]|nr:hypothetical protein [Bacilli bacterium]
MWENLFSLGFMGQEIILPKRDIVFKNGLGLVQAYGYYNLGTAVISVPVVAIVNEQYLPIFKLTPRQIVPKIEMLDNGDIVGIVVGNNEYNNNKGTVYHFYVEDGNENILPLDADNYVVISQDVLKISTLIDGRLMYALYSVIAKSSITCYYDRIGVFNYDEAFGGIVAIATAFIWDEDKKINEVSCMIDEKGNVVSNYKELNSGLEFDIKR